MSKILIIPVGISGSGKSYLGNKLKSSFGDSLSIVCMDDIRKDLLGDVSDQSKNAEVYNKSQNMIYTALRDNKIVYESATNLSGGKQGLLKKISEWKTKFPTLKTFIVFLADSEDNTLCMSRITEDLSKGVDRANTPKDAVKVQAEKYSAMSSSSWLVDQTSLGLSIYKFSQADPTHYDQLVAKIKAQE